MNLHLTKGLLLLGLITIGCLPGLSAQSVSGIVRSAGDNQPSPGVTVQVKGASNGTTTDAEGGYKLSNVKPDDSLIFSFVGFQKKVVGVNGRTNVDVTLTPTISSLSQVVVVGYGTQNRASVTSAIASIENDKLDQIPGGMNGMALAGRLPGVNITNPQNQPGNPPTITIRGTGSISAGNSPLVVIDGFPGGSLANLNMNDVKSIEVLKDAAAAAIYGSRGSGGVIIVTTKSGRIGKTKFNVNAYYGVNKPIGFDDWITGEEFYDYQVKYKNRDFYNAGGDTTLPIWGDPARPATYQVNPVIKEGSYIWQDIVLRPAPIQNYDLSASGGTDKVQYFLSGGIEDQQGALIQTWYKSYSARAKLNVKINDFLTAGIILSPFYSKRRLPSLGIEAMSKTAPFVSPDRNPDGTWPRPLDYWGTSVSAQVSPLATINGSSFYSSVFNNLGQAYLKVNLLEGLEFKTSLDVDYTLNQSERFQAPYATANNTSSGSASNQTISNVISENFFSYNKSFANKHNFNAILGASFQKSRTYTMSMTAIRGTFNNDIIETLNNAQIDANSYTSKTQWGLTSYYARVNYNYLEKYYLSGSYRIDGSSRFGANNRWGKFPSVSAGWRISQEPFLQNNNVIDELKLRASYGEVGNFNIGDFQYLAGIGSVNYSPDNKLNTGEAPTNIGNPDLRWEKTKSLDIGMDLGLFKDRLNFILDFYRKRTQGLLYQVNIPSVTGFSNSLTNTGDIQNQGIEFSINSKNFTGGFKWNTTFNFTYNENKVVRLAEGLDEVINTHSRGMGWILRVGDPMFSYYGYKLIGVFMNDDDLNKYPALPGTKVGNARYQDTNGDGKIDDNDKVILGNFAPKYILGLVNDFSWKGFDLSITLQSSLGAKLYEEENLFYEGPTVSAMRRSLVDHQWWSPSAPGDGMSPSTALSDLAYVANSDYYLENASYLMLRNVNLGYRFPASLIKGIKLDNLRVYVSASNLLVLTAKGFHGYNPEGYTLGGISGIGSFPGYNQGAIPLNKSFVVGINLNF